MVAASPHQELLPAGWPRPSGYSNGVSAEGRLVVVAGQIGWDLDQRFPPTFAGQVRQALTNIAAVMAEGGAEPRHLVRMTWFVTDIETYTAELKAVGEAYQAALGRNYPAMTLVQVVRLVEPAAQVEIEATAVVPPAEG